MSLFAQNMPVCVSVKNQNQLVCSLELQTLTIFNIGCRSSVSVSVAAAEVEEAGDNAQQADRQGSGEDRATTANHVYRPKDRQRTAGRALYRQGVSGETAA